MSTDFPYRHLPFGCDLYKHYVACVSLQHLLMGTMNPTELCGLGFRMLFLEVTDVSVGYGGWGGQNYFD